MFSQVKILISLNLVKNVSWEYKIKVSRDYRIKVSRGDMVKGDKVDKELLEVLLAMNMFLHGKGLE